MGWERTRTEEVELSAPPSLSRWLLAGALMVIIGVLFFIMHASGSVKVISSLNVWWFSLAPVGGWLLLFCIRSYLWGRKVNEYQFLRKEADYAQQQWEKWAERHLVILSSVILLPDKITAPALMQEREQQYGLTRRIDYLPLFPDAKTIKILLNGIDDTLKKLPVDLPLQVTLLVDVDSDGITEAFSFAWQELFPHLPMPAVVTTTDSLPFARLEERIKQPLLSVELVLVMQFNGANRYSDALAALLLTTDDVAQKYQLPHTARLYRPMPIDMAAFDADITLFLRTQTIACKTTLILGDVRAWTEMCAALITQGGKVKTQWKAEDILLMEKWCGIPGPYSSWLLTALATDLVRIHKPSLLALFTDDREHFVCTIASGSEDEYTG